MKFLYIFLMAFCVSSSLVDSDSIKLETHLNVQSTFSGSALGDQSFHLIIAKNTEKKHFEIIPISNNDGQLRRFDPIIFEHKPIIQSFLNTNDVASLVVSSKGDKHDDFTVVDLNLNDGRHERSETISGKDFKAVFQNKQNNILLFSNKEEMRFVEIQDASSIKEIEVESTANNKALIKELGSVDIEVINSEDFVANGSINEFRAYYDDGTVYITQDDIKTASTSVFKMSLNDENPIKIDSKTYKSTTEDDIKKSTSFVSANNLYQLQLNKTKGDINLYNLKHDDVTTLDISELKIARESEGFTSVEQFLKLASKKKYQPTVSVNQNISGDVTVRFDYVNKETYRYNGFWWAHDFWFHQQMMMQQQMMRHHMQSRFRPSPEEDVIYYAKEEAHYFEVIFNTDKKNIVVNDFETIYKDVDKKKQIEILERKEKFKHSSKVFNEEYMRYFGYDKKSKSFKVISKPIK